MPRVAAAAPLSIGELVGVLRAQEDYPLVAYLDLPVVDWQGTRLSANDRYPTVKVSRGRQIQPEKNRRTSHWRELALVKARGLRLGLSRGRVEIVYRYPDNIRREVSNLQPTSKAIVDGLVDAGIFPDDKDGVLVGPDNRRDPVNGPHQVRVLIYGTP